jgi:hypothetical protein
VNLLVVSAIRFEAEASLEVLKKQYTSVDYFEIGVGPLAAAKSEARLGDLCTGRTVLYLGSCGSFYEFEKPTLVTVDKVYWMPPCVRTGIAEIPERFFPSPIEFPKPTLDLPQKSVLTTPSISLVSNFAPKISESLEPHSSLVENMELYACAEGLLKARSLHIILGVSNQVGPDGRRQWAQNFRDAAYRTAQFLEKNLF